jgi:hypothetical protein
MACFLTIPTELQLEILSLAIHPDPSSPDFQRLLRNTITHLRLAHRDVTPGLIRDAYFSKIKLVATLVRRGGPHQAIPDFAILHRASNLHPVLHPYLCDLQIGTVSLQMESSKRGFLAKIQEILASCTGLKKLTVDLVNINGNFAVEIVEQITMMVGQADARRGWITELLCVGGPTDDKWMAYGSSC